MKGRGAQLELAQILAVLRGARSLHLSVAHLPTEANDAADALSRQAGPAEEQKDWPFAPDQAVQTVDPINLEKMWGWLTFVQTYTKKKKAKKQKPDPQTLLRRRHPLSA